jgi:membrane fusion protein (multidrug efflux system)
MPAPEIPVVVTKAEEVTLNMEFVGQIYGAKDIPIRARVEGVLEGIHFEEGFRVKEGDLLYTVERQQYEAGVAAKMSLVAEAETMLAKAESDLARIRPLAEKRAVSQSDLDAAVAIKEAAQASVEAARANLEAAEIQLGYTRITSPISGLIGKTRAKVGEFVGRDPNPVILNVVSQIDTVLVEFFVTEAQYLERMRNFNFDSISMDQRAEMNRNDQPRLTLSDGYAYPHAGAYEFIDREIDPTTGSIRVQASFPNPELLLRPGQFARVKVVDRVVEDGITVPQRCVMELQGLYSVYVVTPENKVARRDVTVGQKVGRYWLITDGLSAGEQVVYEGLQKISAGDTVNPVVTDIEAENAGGE